MDVDKLHNEAEELEVYANLEGSEQGELCNKLIGLANGLLDYGSEEFGEALANEISSQLAWFKANTTIETEEVPCTRTHKYLEYKD